MTPASLRILLVADFKGPTQQISLYNPLAPMILKGECHLEALTEAELQNSAKTGAVNAPDRAMKDRFERAFHLTRPHIVIFSRYGGPLASDMLKITRGARVPIIAHFDDDLLGVPADLGPDKYRRYNDPARLEAIRTVLRESDLIYASTPALADRLKVRGFDVPICAGNIYCSGKALPDMPYTEPPVVGYMGSGGHAHDLAIALPGIVRLLHARPAMRFELFGTIPMPESLRGFGGRVVHHPFNSDYNAFLQQLGKLGWSAGLAPLADVPFNTVKANTKWVEYTSARMAVVASDHSVYRESCANGCGLLVKADGWFESVSAILDNNSERTEMIARARTRLERDYAPERLLSQLLSVLSRAGATLPITSLKYQEP